MTDANRARPKYGLTSRTIKWQQSGTVLRVLTIRLNIVLFRRIVHFPQDLQVVSGVSFAAAFVLVIDDILSYVVELLLGPALGLPLVYDHGQQQNCKQT